jgi:hypothetical protein
MMRQQASTAVIHHPFGINNSGKDTSMNNNNAVFTLAPIQRHQHFVPSTTATKAVNMPSVGTGQSSAANNTTINNVNSPIRSIRGVRTGNSPIPVFGRP